MSKLYTKFNNFINSINESINIPEGKKALIVLVGPPAVGKSTWTKNNFPDSYIINRDDIVDKVASTYGWTSDDMFSIPPKSAIIGDTDEKFGTVINAPKWMTWTDTVYSKVREANKIIDEKLNKRIGYAVYSGKNIIVDMTNLDSKSRKNSLRIVKKHRDEYYTIAVIFKFQGFEDIIKKISDRRAKIARNMGKTKTIPHSSLDRIFSSYEKPTKEEGFDEIINVDNIEELKKALVENNI